MYYKQIFPLQVLNLQATEFICELYYVSGSYSSRTFEIEFYDKLGQPILSRVGKISGLPVYQELVENSDPNTFDYSSPEAQSMFKEQNKIIFDNIKRYYGLLYYDDTFEENVDRGFSYERYVTPKGVLNISMPVPVNISLYDLKQSYKSEEAIDISTEEDLKKFLNDYLCEKTKR